MSNGSVGLEALDEAGVADNASANGTAGLLYEPSVGIVVLLSTFYGVISVGAVVGNTLVIYMVVRSRRMRTITNFFIANLALSDVVIGTFAIPFQFQAALLQRWNLPRIMCPLCPFFGNVSMNTSIFTLIAIAMDRYNAIIHPLSGKSSKQGTKIRIGVIWFFSILLAIPQLIAFRIEMMEHEGGHIPQCVPVNIPPMALQWYIFALCFVQYFLPLSLIMFAYLRIAMKLWGAKAPGEGEKRRDAQILRNKKRAIKVLIFVVVLFALCWLPLQTYRVLTVIAPIINHFAYINIIWFASHWLAMSNSCLNPFIYFFCHDKFKHEFQNQFQWCFRKVSKRRHLQRNQASFTTHVPPDTVGVSLDVGHTSSHASSDVLRKARVAGAAGGRVNNSVSVNSFDLKGDLNSTRQETVNYEYEESSHMITKEKLSVYFTKDGVVLSTTKDTCQAGLKSQSRSSAFNSRALRRSNSWSTKI